MGRHNKNKATLDRQYEPERKLIAKVQDTDYGTWYTKEFEWDDLGEALQWIKEQMKERVM